MTEQTPTEAPRFGPAASGEDWKEPDFLEGDYEELPHDGEEGIGDDPVNEAASDEPVEVASPGVMEEEKRAYGVIKP